MERIKRKQQRVSEHHPQVQEEREKWRNAASNVGDSVFDSVRYSYFIRHEWVTRSEEYIAQLHSDIAEIRAKDPSDEPYEGYHRTLLERVQKSIVEAEERLERDRAEIGTYTERWRNGFSRTMKESALAVRMAEYDQPTADFVISQVRVMLGYEGNKRVDALEEPELSSHFMIPEEFDKELHSVFGDDLSKLSVENLYIAANNGLISDEFIRTMSERHKEFFEAQSEELERFVEEVKADYREQIASAVQEGWLPQQATDALHRIDDVSVILTDKMKNLRSSSLGSIDSNGRIRIDSADFVNTNYDRVRASLFHEFTHAISGTAYNVLTIDGGNDKDYYRFELNKVGLHVRGHHTWLNEAVTDTISLRLSGFKQVDEQGRELGYKGSETYPNERQDYDRLIEAGLDEALVMEAYFENFVDNAPEGETSEEKEIRRRRENVESPKAFSRLVKAVNTIEGAGGFLRKQNEYLIDQITRFAVLVSYTEGSIPIKEEREAGDRYFIVTIDMGVNDNTRATKQFYTHFSDRSIGDSVLTVEDQMKKYVVDKLDLGCLYYGTKKMKYTIREV